MNEKNTEQQWKRFRTSGESHSPHQYLDKDYARAFANDFDLAQPLNWHSQALKVTFLREASFHAQGADSGAIREEFEPRWQSWGYAWVRLLTDIESRMAILPLRVALDKNMYRNSERMGTSSQAGRIPARFQPKPRKEWNEGWNRPCNQGTAPGTHPPLPWLESVAEHLTIRELELALTVFDWRQTRPQFVWWIEAYPLILRRIHRFLLQSYCWWLLAAFEEACGRCPCHFPTLPAWWNALHRRLRRGNPVPQKPDAAALDAPAFRAGEMERAHIRMLVLAFVGLTVLLNLTPLREMFFEAPKKFGFFLALLQAVGLGYISYLDVYKHNHGFIASFSHARPRIIRLFTRLFGAGFVVSAAMALILQMSLLCAPDLPADALKEVENEVLRYRVGEGWATSWRYLLGLINASLASSGIGALVLWIWEDRAATEPF